MAVKTTKRTKKAEKIEEVVMDMPAVEFGEGKKGKNKKLLTWGGGILVLILVLGFWSYKTNNFPIVAMVGLKPITRYQVENELYKENGKAMLSNLVTEQLLNNELDKLGINVTDDEVNNQLETLKKGIPAGQDFNQLLAAQGLTVDEVKKQLKLKMRVDKVVADKTAVTDQDVAAYIKENSDYMTATTEAGRNDEARLALEQQKSQTAITDWVNSVKAKSKVWYSDPTMNNL